MKIILLLLVIMLVAIFIVKKRFKDEERRKYFIEENRKNITIIPEEEKYLFTQDDNIINKRWPFYKKRLLTRPEQSFYFKLVEALPEFLIFSQVQLSRILGVEKGENYYQWYNRINRMSVDFVVCNKATEIIALVELDDSSHERNERKEADQKKDKACRDAGIEIIRWHVKALPDKAEIRQTVIKIYE